MAYKGITKTKNGKENNQALLNSQAVAIAKGYSQLAMKTSFENAIGMAGIAIENSHLICALNNLDASQEKILADLRNCKSFPEAKRFLDVVCLNIENYTKQVQEQAASRNRALPSYPETSWLAYIPVEYLKTLDEFPEKEANDKTRAAMNYKRIAFLKALRVGVKEMHVGLQFAKDAKSMEVG